MRRFILFFFFLFFIAISLQAVNNNENKLKLIPYPQILEMKKGEFSFNQNTPIIIPSDGIQFQDYFASMINKLTAIDITFSKRQNGNSKEGIEFLIDEKSDKEGYILEVTNKYVKIISGSQKGLFLGSQTFIQLLSVNKANSKISIPCLLIKDKPNYLWRGLNLDCSRHFMTKDFIKRYIDLLAFYKMNVLHLHLVDDQGWRVEIKKYPKLTEVGAWRKESEGKTYGGFYSQEDLKEIVAYAKDRFITVVPEIEMPGHSVASLASYPEHSCTGGPFEVETQWGVMLDVYCAGNDKVFTFLEDVLTEVISIFPSQYIHIGGDEVPKDRWKECTKCQARIKEEGLLDEKELQSYFIKRIEKFLSSKGKKLIGWDEILEGGLAPSAIVQSWQGFQGAVAAAKSKHYTIVSPQSHTYFNADIENTDLEKAYSFNPIPNGLTADEEKYVMGGEANIWTEYAPQETIDGKLFPRILALSEVLWLENSKKDYSNFYSRLQNHYPTLSKLNVTYGLETKVIKFTHKYNPNKKVYEVSIKTGQPGYKLRYTTDGSIPNSNSSIIIKTLLINSSSKIKVAAFKDNYLVGKIDSLEISFHKGLNKPVKLFATYSPNYAANGIKTLTDGIRGTNKFRDNYYQGYEGVDFEAVIDLETVKRISNLTSGYIQDIPSWIFMPEYVEYFYSIDGNNFTSLGIVKNDIDQRYPNPIRKDFTLQFAQQEMRYIKVKSKGTISCPAWHKGAGGKSWIFIDEIIAE